MPVSMAMQEMMKLISLRRERIMAGLLLKEWRKSRDDNTSFTSGASNTWAPSGIAIVNDQLYVVALRGTAVLAFDINKNKHNELLSEFGRIRDVFVDENFFILLAIIQMVVEIRNLRMINYIERHCDIIFEKTWNARMNGEDKHGKLS